MRPVGSLMRGMIARIEERRSWTQANPEIAAAWDEANREEHERASRREREAAQEDERHRLPVVLRRVGFPLDAVDALRQLRHSEPAIEAAKKWLRVSAEEATFLLLLGAVGTGKTTAAAFAVSETLARSGPRPHDGLSEQRERVIFTEAATLARVSGYNSDDKAWFEDACACELFVLDDLGAEASNAFSKSLLEELLVRRHKHRLRTIITSNLSRETFARRIEERLYDRISTSCVMGTCSGKSLRQKYAVKHPKP